MRYFLLERRNTFKQYRETRRNGAKPSGVVVVHTAENITDFLGRDPGAEGVARFIAYRNDPGSYHRLCDSDSTIAMAPWSYECWHDTRTNNHAVGLAAAVASKDWRALGSRGDAIVVRMALAAREYDEWLRNERGISVPPRLITRAQALARIPGFVGHGTVDPGRRSDPGRDFNWGLLLSVFADASLASNAGGTIPGFTIPTAGGNLPAPLEEDDLPYTEDQLRRIISEEVGKSIDDRQLRDRKDMLEQATKAVAPVLQAIAAVPGRLLETFVGGDELPAPAGRVGILLRDTRLIVRRFEDAWLKATASTTTPEPTRSDDADVVTAAGTDTTQET